MEIFFNELSVFPSKGIQKNEYEIIRALIKSLKFIDKLNHGAQPKFFIKNQEVFDEGSSFICGKSLIQICKGLQSEERTAILSFFHRIVVMTGAAPDIHIEGVTGQQTDAYSSYINGAQKSLSICLYTSEEWNQPELEFTSVGTKVTEKIRNITNLDIVKINDAITYVAPLLKYFALGYPVGHRAEILRKSAVSNFLMDDYAFSKLLKSAGRLVADERNAIFGVVGTLVAEINDYTHNNRLSTMNSSAKKTRKIFTSTDQEFHISIDFMHGCFEVHDKRGIHLKEISFAGQEISPKDKRGAHDIRVT